MISLLHQPLPWLLIDGDRGREQMTQRQRIKGGIIEKEMAEKRGEIYGIEREIIERGGNGTKGGK